MLSLKLHPLSVVEFEITCTQVRETENMQELNYLLSSLVLCRPSGNGCTCSMLCYNFFQFASYIIKVHALRSVATNITKAYLKFHFFFYNTVTTNNPGFILFIIILKHYSVFLKIFFETSVSFHLPSRSFTSEMQCKQIFLLWI